LASMTCTRRALAFLFPALASAQQPASALETLPSAAIPFERLKGRKSGAIELYQILTGQTRAGYKLDLHESDLLPRAIPHAPHRHVHEELLFVREGEMEVMLDGKWTRLGPGSCAYMASNDVHGYRNSSSAVAKYFVLALGTD
jgi:mannose-6-phosphate isomerase-like protein (cupin superfamily)